MRFKTPADQTTANAQFTAAVRKCRNLLVKISQGADDLRPAMFAARDKADFLVRFCADDSATREALSACVDALPVAESLTTGDQYRKGLLQARADRASGYSSVDGRKMVDQNSYKGELLLSRMGV